MDTDRNNENGSDEKRLMSVERLLRAERGVELSSQFRQRVMAAVRALPAPELLAPRRSWRDLAYTMKLLGNGEKVALGMVLVGIMLFLIPGASDVLASFAWEFGDMTVNFNIGETALSASLLSIIAMVAGALFVTGVGAYAAKNNLTSA